MSEPAQKTVTIIPNLLYDVYTYCYHPVWPVTNAIIYTSSLSSQICRIVLLLMQLLNIHIDPFLHPKFGVKREVSRMSNWSIQQSCTTIFLKMSNFEKSIGYNFNDIEVNI
jgi:hypothetical protein